MSKKPITKEYRIRFVTKDGSVVMNRHSDGSVMGESASDVFFREYVLKKDATEHGVRVVSTKKVDSHTLEAIVEWL